jgi:hypothetical protein
MLFLPPILPVLPAAVSVAVQQDQGGVKDFGGVTIAYTELSGDFESGVIEATGTVVITKGETVVTCPKVTIWQDEGRALASGPVLLTDPAGSVEAAEIEIFWATAAEEPDPNRLKARAEDAHVRIGPVQVFAASVEIRKDLWTILNGHGLLTRKDSSPVRISADSLDIVPGESGTAKRIFFTVFGTHIGPIPQYTFLLDERFVGLMLPVLTMSSDSQIGFSWGHALKLSDRSALGTDWAAFPGQFPTFGMTYSYSPLEKGVSRARLRPETDMGERAANGWFNTIRMKTPEDEEIRLRRKRLSYSLSTSWNTRAYARPIDIRSVSKLAEATLEIGGGTEDGYGYMLQTRLQRIRPDSSTAFLNRAELVASTQAPIVKLTDDLDLRLRSDVFGTVSEKSEFGWVRGEAGLVYEPNEQFRIGAAFVQGSQFGTPDFAFDPLYSTRAAHVRADLEIGPWTGRYLAKYDLNLESWYDREFELAIAADGFEPFILVRQQPNEFMIGFRFRMNEFVDLMKGEKLQDRR